MSAGILLPFLGKDLLVVITPQDISALGVFSNNAAGTFSFRGRLDTADSTNELQTEPITPMNVFQDNPVPTGLTGSYNITEIMAAAQMPANAGADTFGKGNILMKCSTISFYHKLVLTKYDRAGTPASIETETVYGLMTVPRSIQYARGKNVLRATFQTVAVFDSSDGSVIANPAYS